MVGKSEGKRPLGRSRRRWENNIVSCKACAWLTERFWIGWLDLLAHNTRNYNQYSAIVDLHALQFTVTHALGFSVLTSRVPAEDLQQSHCHFKSHMKSSLHSLIPFLPLFCSCQFRTLDSIQFLCSQAHILAGWRLESRLSSSQLNSSL
jgi:hypothetical protein